MQTEINTIAIPSLSLECGNTLQDVELIYERTGNTKGPVILVCHALTGNHIVKGTDEEKGWWSELIGPNDSIDTNHFNVISFNVLGGCDGSTGPTSINPKTGVPYGGTFPVITIRDMVNAQYEGLKELSIHHLHAVIGGSLGGMQALEWGTLYPRFVDKVFALAVTPVLSDYGIAFNHIGIKAIEENHTNKEKGLEIARMIGMVTYRTPELFDHRFKREQVNTTFNVESYLEYQGEKLAQRFDPNSYLTLLKAMNSHDIGRKRGGITNVARDYQCELITVSYEGDIIYSPSKLKEFSQQVSRSHHYFVSTAFGHDGFLVEFEKWGGIISTHLKPQLIPKLMNG
ncbi:homoserine O-acetyltransferase MetX [Rossellomorea aquimaris]|uniref:homoserine O-acetyltransferase MetX n=1 Tax=Rossellomorea aquimaris TaxID=189382 RepID=UPI0007D06AE8|nr:homoserine O-acetyltransferase [Rossellomorea aquimaris]